MSIYNSLYSLLNIYIFGGTIEVGTIPDLVATLLSTCGVVFLVAIPFIIVYKVISLVCGGWR